ncbi:MAG TPA: purine-nucleoside phosphorylase [Acidimicrobiales bacterium]|nr:purine-nucleoside phosphorylase [Acidimicrobiales bacterium]
MTVTGASGLDDPFSTAAAAAAELGRRTGGPHDVAVVLGSGWQGAVGALGAGGAEVLATELPGFAPPTVPGHEGRLRSVDVAGRRVLLLVGRVHLYEGRSPAEVVHPVRVAVAAGARVVVLTNAAGGINPGYRVGQTVLILDHLNLTGTSPLAGAQPPAGYPPRFVDLTDCWSARLRSVARSVDPDIEEGVYAGLLGPHYETPAEIAALGRAGADLVGMSTVLEAIAARHLGAEVLGLSLVTNAAAGVTAAPITHAEVLSAGADAAPGLARLIGEVVAKL